jgi:hypothetical protein
MSNNNVVNGFDSSDSILPESTQSCQDLSKLTQSCQALITAINNFPQEWALTPCIGKRNLWPNWNKSKLDRAQLIEAIRSQTNHEGKPCKWTGVSVVTGPLSNGIMAIDFDGPLALQKYLELSGQLPPTKKRWTSGKLGHFQILLQVPPENWEGLKPQKIELNGGQKLELRWNQCSTLPPSIHPDTGKPYFWKNTEEIVKCPDFILDLMREAPTVELPQNPKSKIPTRRDEDEKSLVDLLEQEILPRLDAEEFYGSYLKLKSAGKNLKALCPFHDEKTPSFSVSPVEKTFHCFGCGVGGGPVQFLHQIKGGSGSPTGKDFYFVVMELADRVGVKIGDHKFNQNPKPDNILQHPTTNNVVRPKEFQLPPFSELEGEIDTLLDSDLKKSQVQIKISELAQKFRMNSADVSKIYREREQEREQEVNREDTAVEVARLLEIKQSKIELSEILPTKLAEPIERLAKLLNLKPECYLAALLTQVSALFKVGTEVLLRRDSNYRCTPNYFAGIVAESSQKKSPIMKAMLTLPMKPLQEKARKEYEEACQAFEKEYSEWKAAKGEDKGPAPKEPRQRIYHFSKTTGEGILYQVQAFPDQALMYRCDELAGMLKSGNQYRGGKGSDDEDLLEFWNGTGSTVLRAKGVAVDLDGLLLSIFGTIQPEVLAGFLKDCSDSNGKFARFDFVVQPLAASEMPDEDTELPDTTTHILSSLYKKVDALPKLELELDRDAKKLFATFCRAIEKERVDERKHKQGTRAMLGKMPEKVGKMAAIIHTIDCVVNGVEVDLLIPRSAVEAAIKFVKFTSDQIVNLYTEFSDRSALAPNLMKIIQAAERQGGKITVREAQHLFHIKQRPTAQTAREWFSEIQEMKYGEVTTVKKSALLTLTTTTVTTVAQNLDTEQVKPYHSASKPVTTVTTVNDADCGNCGTTVVTGLPQSKALPNKALEATVVTVVTNSPPSEKSENLLLSYFVEPAEFTDEHRAKMLADKMREVIASSNFEDAKEIVKQVNVSTSQLRGLFWQNLERTKEKNKARLLAFANLSEGTPVKYVGKIEQYVQEKLTAYDADGHGHITCLLADGRGFTTWIPTRDLRKKL